MAPTPPNEPYEGLLNVKSMYATRMDQEWTGGCYLWLNGCMYTVYISLTQENFNLTRLQYNVYKE